MCVHLQCFLGNFYVLPLQTFILICLDKGFLVFVTCLKVLFETEGEAGRASFHSLVYSPHRCRARLKPGTSSGCPARVQGFKHLGHLVLLLPGLEVARIQAGTCGMLVSQEVV